ncbi:RNA polymerase sigma factor [Bacteroides uniformis]|uniref:RNA polymerase sigma factor n=1 Tax=Bacteroides uniformis TaxID=820 RepID=UPI00233EA3B1|nr:RNA polymerase sigma factor [Bacteroides uniformis]MDC1809080.1 RNA polymerase sigma factor [Bacteroides uniformis]
MGKDKETTQFINKITAMYPELRRFAYKLTLDMDSANDLVQDCILKALDNQDKYVYRDNFKGWVFTIMRNIFINNYRQSQRMSNLFDPNVPDECLNRITTEKAGGNIYDAQLIYEAVDNLPERIKEPFTLFMDGLKYREIAEKCDLPLGTVKSRIFFARKMLQEELRDFV